MKKTGFLIILSLFLVQFVCGQQSGNIIQREKGNVNYDNSYYKKGNLNLNPGTDLVIHVKGLSNVKADAYVAIFNVNQVGKSIEEVNELLDTRVKQVTTQLSSKTGISIHVDMLSFVPVYEYEEDKKIFSKKTYNEIPTGFELKKNIHIQYTDPDFIHELMTVCAKAEIYDLVKVDYFAENLEEKKKQLMNQTHEMLQNKVGLYNEMLELEEGNGESLKRQVQIADGFQVIYPIEMYQSYQAFNSSSLHAKKSSQVRKADKVRTYYYQALANKDFDVVINPVINEPVIQVVYEAKVRIKRYKESKQPDKQYYILTPNGDLKPVEIQK